MKTPSDYYAFRKGAERPPLEYADLQRLVSSIFERLEEKGWFQEALGKDCVDDHKDVGAIVLERLGQDFWPLSSAAREQTEEWLFSMIEFAYGHVAKPIKSNYHSWDECGVHVVASDRAAGRDEFRTRMNELLHRYSARYELRTDGEVWALAPAGFEDYEPVATKDPNVDDRVESAIRTFRKYGATDDDKRHAIRDLADVFEYLRDTVGTQLLTKDESDLFTIANNFGIRHHNSKQKNDYDSDVWLEWVFLTYLNTVGLVTRLLRAEPIQSS